MLGYLEQGIAEEAPTRNWDGPDAVCDSEEDEETEALLCGAELREAWCRDGPKWDALCAVVLALRGPGTALVRSAYSDAVVQGVLALENRLLLLLLMLLLLFFVSQLPFSLLLLFFFFTTPPFSVTGTTQSVSQVC